MCGIAGIVRVHEHGAGSARGPVPDPLSAIPERWLDILDDAIAHRGPDGCGRFRDRAVHADGRIVDVALVHRRLSILDHAGGHQPMVHEGPAHAGKLRPDLTSAPGEPPRLASHALPDARHVGAIVFNGCIYNHRTLRQQLLAAGHRFETDHSDTEVLLHTLRAWGPAALERCEGMLAAAIWDRASASLTLLRDIFGEKPLYLAASRDGLSHIFASTAAGVIRALAAADEPIELDAPQLVEWIAMGHHPTLTPVRGLTQLPAGAWRTLPAGSHGGLGPASRLKPDAEHRSLHLTRGTSASELHRTISQSIAAAVGARLDADVPIACFLSGGIDSSLIAHAAQQHLLARGQRLRTLCVRMPNAANDESSVAHAVADHLGTDHTTVDVAPDPAADLIHLIEQLGLPFADSSLLPTHWVSRAASDIARVALGGDGGDELFLGYRRQILAGDLVPLWTLSLGGLMLPGTLLPRRASTADEAARALAAASRRSYRSLQAITQHRDLAHLLGASSHHCSWNDRANTIDAARSLDLDAYLPGDLLRKVDTASMACPIEVRSPMLDVALARLALSAGAHTLRRGSRSGLSHAHTKGMLRDVARALLPASVVDRPKRGFSIPIGSWFRSDFGGLRQMLRDHIESPDAFAPLNRAGVEIDTRSVRRMLREHDAAGERSVNPWHGRDHSQRLYVLLGLSLWCRWIERVQRGG